MSHIIRILLYSVILALYTCYAQEESGECKDKEDWCQANKRFCSSVDSMVKTCPETCGQCQVPECERCEQNCTVRGNKFAECTCLKGYELMADGASCQDIDECVDSPCTAEAPFCENLEGGYTCTEGTCTKFLTHNFIEYYSKKNKCCKMTLGKCGQNALNKPSRIVGGQNAMIKSWPWMVYFQLGNNLCGGTLISDLWILSAGHCFASVVDFKKPNIEIKLGVHDTRNIRASHVRRRKAAEIIRHEKYNFPNYDIALVRMNRAVQFSDYIHPICLPDGEQPEAGTTCYASGYGVKVFGGLPARVLQQVDLPIVNADVCKEAYKEEHAVKEKIMICAGYVEGGKDACQGDSGGPLVCQRCNNCDWYLAGVTSFGEGCAKPGFYGVYTRVEHFEQWIADKMGKGKLAPRGCTPVAWSNWGKWGKCSKTCGQGTHTRIRYCQHGKPNLPGCLGNDFESTECNQGRCIEDTWSNWSNCPVTCGEGVITRERICSTRGCVPATEKKACYKNTCPSWSNWRQWSKCDSACDGGERTRSRTCLNAVSDNVRCTGSSSQTEMCNEAQCPTEPAPSWNPWSAWTDCQVTCGGGMKTSSRTCIGATAKVKCPDSSVKTIPCNTNLCLVNFTPWSIWSKCSVTCGNGSQKRIRTCPDFEKCESDRFGKETQEMRKCEKMVCPGEWTVWSAWGECTSSCGVGERVRHRSCMNGKNCIGSRSNSEKCSKGKCGQWTEWSSYSACSKTCDGGTRRRIRECEINGVEVDTCIGENLQTSGCAEEECKGSFSEWTKWSKCSKTCGGGKQIKTRFCPKTVGCESDEFGQRIEQQNICNQQTCVGQWTSWSPWGECSMTCGPGTRRKIRSCENGINCPGNDDQAENCIKLMCPEWSTWSEFSTCSVTCGGGTKVKTRTCRIGDQEATGCEGEETRSEECANEDCREYICVEECLQQVAYGSCALQRRLMDTYCHPDCCAHFCKDFSATCEYALCGLPGYSSDCLTTCGYCPVL